jgi:multidrug efflux pump subunit AcrA (membrane-fusion protein)
MAGTKRTGMTDANPPADVGAQLVPKLRIDLQVRPGPAPGVVDVGDMVTGRTFPMRDFEVSIARMLDGQRTLADTVDAAQQIGIPLSLAALEQFVTKLRSFGFLDENRTAPPAVPPAPERLTWPPRSEWNDEERKLYQQALKHFREDRHAEAKALVEQMLRRRPMAPEAKDLMARIEEARAAGPASGSFAKAYSEAEASWFARGESGVPPLTGGHSVPSAPKRRPKWLFAVPAVALLAVAIIPVAKERTLPVALVPGKVLDVHPPHAGTLEAVLVKTGQQVKAGDPLVRFDTADAKMRADKLGARVGELQRQLKRPEIVAKSPKAAKARAQQAKREALLAKATSDRDKLLARTKGKRTPQLAKADKQVAQLQAAAQKGTAEVEAATQAKAVATAQEELRAAQQARESAATDVRDVNVAAPAEGAVLKLDATPKQAVTATDVLAQLGDTRTLRAVFKAPREAEHALSAGETVSLSIGGKTVQGTIASVGTAGKSDADVEVSADVPNPQGALAADASGSIRLPMGSQALVSCLFGR